jgi:hypothetical protein
VLARPQEEARAAAVAERAAADEALQRMRRKVEGLASHAEQAARMLTPGARQEVLDTVRQAVAEQASCAQGAAGGHPRAVDRSAAAGCARTIEWACG